MKNFSLKSIFAMLWIVLLSVGCTEEAEDMFGSILGKVTDAQTGEVIQGVTVQLNPGGLSRTTGSDGTFEFTDLEAVQYQLQASKADYVTNTKSITVVVGKASTGDISLTPVNRLELSASVLNFGKGNSSLSFDIRNKGTSKFNWNISGLGSADWLEVKPASGALEGGKSCAVQVTLLRDKLTEDKELALIVNTDRETASLQITAEADKRTAKVEIDPTVLDFGTDEGVLTFNIKNTGNAGAVDWNITGLDVDWITIAPMKGTLEQEKTQAVKVTLARALVKDHVKATVLINAAGESIPLEIMADEKKERRIEADPVRLELGDKEKATLTLTSYYGSTSYMLLKKEEGIDWLTLSKTSGTIPQYDVANPAMKETIELSVSRAGMLAGDYSCTLVVRSDLADLEIPVTMKVKESDTQLSVDPTTIDFGQEKVTATFTVQNVGNVGSLDWNITEEPADWVTVSPLTGTLPVGRSATVTLTLDRAKLTAAAGTGLTVMAGSESVRVAISADVKPQREFKVQPTSLAIGTGETASFTMYSNNGSTSYQLLTKESVAWLTFSQATGIVKENGMETINVQVNRESLAPGDYACTIVVRTDLGDTEIPVTMTVEKPIETLVIPQGLYVYYKFDDDFTDATENAVHGFGVNSPTFVEGVTPASKAVKFSKSNNSYFSVGKPIVDSREMTVSFWGKNFEDGIIFYMISSVQNQPMFTLSMKDGFLKFIVTRYNNVYQYGQTGTFTHPTLSDGNWHHIALASDFNKTTYSTVITRLYVDGQLVDTISESANVFSEAETGSASYGTGLKFVMGGTLKLNNSTTLNATNMSVDNFRVYDTRELSGEEIKNLYDAKQ